MSHFAAAAIDKAPRVILRGPQKINIPCLGPVASIAWEEAQRAGITYAQIIGKQRAQRYVKPRHTAMWRASHETLASLAEIGRVFGGRDHSSVIHAIRKVEAEKAIKENPSHDQTK